MEAPFHVTVAELVELGGQADKQKPPEPLREVVVATPDNEVV